MTWIKDSVLDILVLVLLGVLSFTSYSILEIVIWVYTGILLFSKILYFFVGYLKTKANKTQTPDWFYHLIYFLGIGVLLFGSKYYLAGAWGLIWILSIIATLPPPKKTG